MKKYSKTWWKQYGYYAGIRAVKTVCQTAVATIGTSALIEQVDWKVIVSSSVLAGIVSLLTSLAGLPEIDAPSGK